MHVYARPGSNRVLVAAATWVTVEFDKLAFDGAVNVGALVKSQTLAFYVPQLFIALCTWLLLLPLDTHSLTPPSNLKQ